MSIDKIRSLLLRTALNTVFLYQIEHHAKTPSTTHILELYIRQVEEELLLSCFSKASFSFSLYYFSFTFVLVSGKPLFLFFAMFSPLPFNVHRFQVLIPWLGVFYPFLAFSAFFSWVGDGPRESYLFSYITTSRQKLRPEVCCRTATLKVPRLRLISL